MSFNEFINMGGYGFYIWSSYGMGLLVFASLVIANRRQRMRLIKQIRIQTRLDGKLQQEIEQ